MYSEYLMSNDKDLFWCYIKQTLNGTFHLSPHENICTIALINIHYLYTIALINVYYLYTSCYV